MKFIVDKNSNKIIVEREFAASLERVWAAWTQREILDKWWAPHPWKTRTKEMDFREGGHWLYAMVGPKNEEHWCRADYKSINPMKSYSGLDAFCDNKGNVNTEHPRSLWLVAFSEKSDSTIVNVEVKYDSLNDLEKIIEMGFKEGFTMAMGNLDKLLAS